MTEEFIDLNAENTDVETTEMEIEIEETIGWVADTEVAKHIDLPDRNTPDQHIISSISGLQEKLDEIESLKTVRSNKHGVANYYEWESGAYDTAGYFVSLAPDSSKIKICDGSDIFGVTVKKEDVGFVGNEDTTPRGNNYGLVVTSGLVDVRCESGIEVGNYVVANKDGLAVKTDSNCGYKVIAKDTMADGTECVSIALGVQACTTDLLGHRVGRLEEDLDNAEINIQAAMKLANEATAMAGASNATSSETQEKIDAVIDSTNNMLEEVSGALNDIDIAKKAAQDAAYQADVVATQAVNTANEAMAKAGELESTVNLIDGWTYTDPVTGITHTGAEYFATYVEDGLSTKASMETVEKLDTENKLLIEKNAESYNQMISSIDKYSIGECSQSYGLTLEQARNILRNGMIYIPTESHKETYRVTIGDKDYSFEKEFTDGFYYIWQSRSFEITTDDGTKDITGYWWSERADGVWHSPVMLHGTSCEFWYDNYTLYKLEGANWADFKKSVWTGIEAPTTEYDYWFVDNTVKLRSIDENGAEIWSPYKTAVSTEQPTDATYEFWYDGEIFHTHWFEVNTIAGNANSRISSMLRQDVDAITAEIVNAHGSVAGFGAWLTDVEATANMETMWKDPVTGEETMSYIGLKSNDDGSSMSLTVRGKDDKAHETITGITLAQNDNGSSILIDADSIVIEGESVFKTTEGQTRIDGGLIETGSIKSGAIATDALQSLEYSETEGKAYSDKGTFFNLVDGSIKSTNFAVDESGKLHAKGADIEGTINATDGKIGQFTIKDGYMNLMVSGPKNLVMDGDDEVRYLTYDGAASTQYHLDPSSNNGDTILEDIGYIVPGRTYTVLIDLQLKTQRTEVSDNDMIKLTVYYQQYTLSEIPIQVLNERHEIVATFELASKYLESSYIRDMKQNSHTYAPIVLTSPITDEESSDSIEIYEIKIVEGDHREDIYMDEAGLVTSDFSSDTMSWSIMPDKCVWWNQNTTKQEPLMRLNRDGLYVKGEIEATSGNFKNCTIDESCIVNGRLSAVGCLTVDELGQVYYSPTGEKTDMIFYIHPTKGVNILKGNLGGWGFDANFGHFKSGIYSTANMAGANVSAYTTLTPQSLIVQEVNSYGVNTEKHEYSWISILNAVKTILSTPASVEESE